MRLKTGSHYWVKNIAENVWRVALVEDNWKQEQSLRFLSARVFPVSRLDLDNFTIIEIPNPE